MLVEDVLEQSDWGRGIESEVCMTREKEVVRRDEARNIE